MFFDKRSLSPCILGLPVSDRVFAMVLRVLAQCWPENVSPRAAFAGLEGNPRLSAVPPPQIQGRDLLKVARLQSEFCTKDFFRATNFRTKNAPKFSPNFLSLCSVGQKKSLENSLQISHKIFQISLRKIKRITDELLQERREKIYHPNRKDTCAFFCFGT